MECYINVKFVFFIMKFSEELIYSFSIYISWVVEKQVSTAV